jgi:protein-S-isoprenylcysteine O-methyltransferase Ste14
MNVEFFFSALTNGWAVGEILLAVFTTTREGLGKIQDRGTQMVLWAVIIGSFKLDDWMHRSFPVDMPGSRSWLPPLALWVLVLGLAIRAVAIVSLGRSFSANVALRFGQTLHRSGLYHLVRHPSYLGLELIFLATAVHTHRWACFAVVLVPPTMAVLYRIRVEEDALRKAFGDEYEDYSRTTRRLIPGVY